MKSYRELIRNKNRVIHMDKMSAYEFDKADLCVFVKRFTTKYPDSDITEQLNEIICNDCDCWDEVRDEEKKRMDIAKELLYSAWKVSYKSGDAYVENCYLFPYKVNEFNGYLFSLHVPSNPTNTYEALSDTSVDIHSSTGWGNKDVRFEEIDFSEFVEAAKKRNDLVIDERLWRLVERDKVIKNT